MMQVIVARYSYDAVEYCSQRAMLGRSSSKSLRDMWVFHFAWTVLCYSVKAHLETEWHFEIDVCHLVLQDGTLRIGLCSASILEIFFAPLDMISAKGSEL